MRLPLVSLCLAGAFASCNCNPPVTPPDAGPGDAGEDVVHGDAIDRYLLPTGSQPLPLALAARTITAWVEKADGTFDAYPGTGADDGTFKIPGVPVGPFIVKLGSTLVATEERVLHLGSNHLGRPDAFVAGMGEGVQLTTTNLAPWGGDDELQFISWSAGQGYLSTADRSPPFVQNRPDGGDTTLTAAVVDFEGGRVPEAARGDDFTIVQLSSWSDGGVTQRWASRSMTPSVTLAIGVPTPVSGAMTALPLLNGDFNLRAGEFVKYAPQVGPGATPFVARLLIDAHPGPFGQTTHSGGTPDLAIIELPADAGDAHLVFQYGNPFSASWRPFVAAGALYDVRYQVTLPDGGATLPRSELGYVTTALQLADAVAGPLAPRISPARAVTLDGQDAMQPLTDVAINPVVAWQAPELGTPTRAEIEVVELSVGIGGSTKRTSRELMRVLPGSRTSIRLPPGFLNPATTYFIRITVLALPAEYLPSTPLVDVGPPAGAAAVLTAAFRTRP